MMHKLLFTVLSLFILQTALLAQKQTGTASYYADKFEGKQTASGEKYKHKKLTAAHKILPFGTIVRVKNLKNGNTVDVRINDRGPFVEGRVIDLSRSAAEQLKFTAQGLTEVEIEVIDAGDGRNSAAPFQVDRTVASDTYFSMKVEREEPKGYGVQIASFQNLDNVLRLSENLKKSYGEVPIVEVKNLNGQKVYAIIIGALKSRKKADELKLEINDRFPDAFVVTY
jgi:rare lipoprotein A